MSDTWRWDGNYRTPRTNEQQSWFDCNTNGQRDSNEPFDCAFQRQQLAALARLCHVEVLATIPYFAGAALLGARTRAGRLEFNLEA